MPLKAKKKAIHVNEEGLVMKKYICLLGVIVALIVWHLEIHQMIMRC